MTARLAFIRGINLGRNAQVPMAELREALAADGFTNVRTYIQSGNVAYDAPPRAGDSPAALRNEGAAITAAIARRRGFAPAVMVRTAGEVANAFAQSPYRDEDPGKAFMIFFDGDSADLGDLAATATSGEQWLVGGGVIHLYCPDGLGTSKLGSKVASSKRLLTTTRNLRTITKLLELAEA